jgi:hypothetical protein
MFKFSRTLQSKLRIKCDVCAVEARLVIATSATSAQSVGPTLLLLPPPDWTQIQRGDRTRHICPICGNSETLVDNVQLMVRSQRWV